MGSGVDLDQSVQCRERSAVLVQGDCSQMLEDQRTYKAGATSLTTFGGQARVGEAGRLVQKPIPAQETM